MIPGLKSGDPVTVRPQVDGCYPIEAWVDNRQVGLVFVTLATAADGSGQVCQLVEEEEGESWARGHRPDVAAVLLLTASC